MLDLGVRLQLFVGPTLPLPAPFELVDALIDAQVTNRDEGRDGFELRFAIDKGRASDYGVVLGGTLEPPARVVVAVRVKLGLQVLIDGVVLQHQLVPSNEPGVSTFVVTGEDVSWHLDRDDTSESVRDRDQGDSTIVDNVLAPYRRHGIEPNVTKTSGSRTDSESASTQQESDRAYVTRLARRNGFVFYVEPTGVPGRSVAYWGPENRRGPAQPALTMNMGPDTNVDEPMVFRFDALAGSTPQLYVVDAATRTPVPVTPSQLPIPSLASRPATPLRKTVLRDSGALSSVDASLRALSELTAGSDSVSVGGQVDAVRYGGALRARRLVGVRGVGRSYDGNYYVRSVTHDIRRGAYGQSFTLTRDGRGSQAAVLAI